MIVLPFSIITMMGGIAILRLWCGVSTNMQCPVDPKSAMSIGGGGRGFMHIYFVGLMAEVELRQMMGSKYL